MMKADESNVIQELTSMARKFVKEREWEVYQTPKNLSIALSIECAELMEIFQWMTDRESQEITSNAKKMSDIQDEASDVLYYLLRLCDKLEIDVATAFKRKIAKSAEKYPIERARGRKEKYTEI